MSRGGGRDRPVAGKQYTPGTDETLEEIATEVYGDKTKANLIWGANAPRKTSKVKKGESIIIPNTAPPVVPMVGKSLDDLTILIDGREVPMQSARILRAMDTCADAWSGRFAWNPGEDPLLDVATRPFGYPNAAAYIGNELLVNGRLYAVEPELTAEGRAKTVTGYSFTVDAVDSHVRPPYERSNITLEAIANAMTKDLGFQSIFEVVTGGKFARTTGHESDSIFVHLSKLATERGILVSCTPSGNMLFWRAKTDAKPVGTLEEGQPGVLEWKGSFDGRKRFHAYHCITAGMKVGAQPQWGKPGAKRVGPSTITEIDPGVPISRFLSFRADDTTPGNILDAARWRKNRQIIDALTQTLPVTGWYAPNGKLWEPNTTVTVISPTLGVPRGYDFLIRAVEFVLEDRRESVLHLIPPAAYTGKDLSDIWLDMIPADILTDRIPGSGGVA